MLMSYLGTLKAWLYRPIFSLFGIGVWSLRETGASGGGPPASGSSSCSLRRLAGNRTAIIGCGLLAADSMYLLTVCFDWGPVALQHLLLVGGLSCCCDSIRPVVNSRSPWGFCCGVWLCGIKALAIWMLGAFGVAGLCVFPRQILRVTTFRRVAISVVAFGIGALPLIVYNVETQGRPFRGQGFQHRGRGGKGEPPHAYGRRRRYVWVDGQRRLANAPV